MNPQSASAVQRAPSVEFHNICRAEQITHRLQAVSECIAKRARELSQAGGYAQGYRQDDWLQAQSEFLRPVPVEIENFADRIRVRATVRGFEADELQASIEPSRIIIAGKKEHQAEQGNRLFYVDWYPDEILQAITLPENVDPELARVQLHAGVLEFDLLKATGVPQWALGVMDI